MIKSFYSMLRALSGIISFIKTKSLINALELSYCPSSGANDQSFGATPQSTIQSIIQNLKMYLIIKNLEMIIRAVTTNQSSVV